MLLRVVTIKSGFFENRSFSLFVKSLYADMIIITPHYIDFLQRAFSTRLQNSALSLAKFHPLDNALMMVCRLYPLRSLFDLPEAGSKKLTFLVPTIPEHRHAQNESKDRVATAKRRGATRSPQGEHGERA